MSVFTWFDQIVCGAYTLNWSCNNNEIDDYTFKWQTIWSIHGLSKRWPSREADLNHRPKDLWWATNYSPPLYQLSYREWVDGLSFTGHITWQRPMIQSSMPKYHSLGRTKSCKQNTTLLSREADLNHRPKDLWRLANYSPPLYQLSYREWAARCATKTQHISNSVVRA